MFMSTLYQLLPEGAQHGPTVVVHVLWACWAQQQRTLRAWRGTRWCTIQIATTFGLAKKNMKCKARVSRNLSPKWPSSKSDWWYTNLVLVPCVDSEWCVDVFWYAMTVLPSCTTYECYIPPAPLLCTISLSTYQFIASYATAYDMIC